MSTYTLEALLRQWMNEELTPDQAIGHILQHLILMHQAQLPIEHTLSIAAAGSPIAPPPTPPPGKRKPYSTSLFQRGVCGHPS